jgi:hypothetical protein
MSGYLQRLVRSARQADERIHPIVGSIFQAPEPKLTAQAPQTDSFGPALGETTTEAQAPSRPAPFALETAAPGSLLAEPDHGNSPEPPARTPLLIDTPGKASQPPAPAPFEPFSIRSHSIPAHPRASGQGVPGTPAPTATVIHDHSDFVPLLESRPERQDPDRSPVRPAEPARILPQRERKPVPSEAARAEPDEISIHIGRIEVTAVPVAAPAPARRRERTGPSLADYLRRRDGRSS